MNIKVALHGMDKRSKERMLTIFSVNFKGQCEFTDIDQADTVIIDMDDKEVNAEWALFRSSYPLVPVIIMATEPVELEDTHYVKKPAKIADLLTAIKESSKKEIDASLHLGSNKTLNAAESLGARIQPASSHSNKPAPASLGIYYSPEKFLQGKVIKAIQEGNKLQKSIFLKCWKDHWIVTFPNTNYLLQNVDDNKIKTLGIVPISDDADHMVYSEHNFTSDEIEHMSGTPTSKVKLTAIEQFLWNLTVKTARGRIPEGVSLDAAYVLCRWPNLPKLIPIANSFRISAFWLNRPQSINNVAEQLGIPLENVLTFFSAALATDILKIAQRKEDGMVTPEVATEADTKRRSVFSALFQIVHKNIAPKKEEAEQDD